MKKRQFLTSAAGLVVGVLGSSVNLAEAKECQQKESQTILTITGDIERTNRGKVDQMKDLFMQKYGIQFDRAYAFTLNDLEKLPSTTISPTMEYDALVHKLSGPRMMDVLKKVGIKNKSNDTKILMHGLDGYSPEISLSDIEKYDFIVATKLDGKLLSIGGFGPLFAIYDADRIEVFAKKPLKERFQACPWGLYCIEVKSS